MATEREIRNLELENGRVPFEDWLDSLRDPRMRAAVDCRLARVRVGNFGDHKRLGGGVSELRIDVGSGLRIYYAEHGKQLVILLGGGEKASQTRDINRAKQLWQQWLRFNK
jgi:putative addiction module killer protein